MSELFLILHKVRGEPAFDIAQRLQIGDEEGWIIPTSGHRAYPVAWQPLFDLTMATSFVNMQRDIPQDWPDHYNTFASREPSVIHTTARELLAKLGLGPSTIKRRKVG